jgi:dTDP-glucose 4,6-dehydratase
MKKIIVSGGYGFIGSNLIRHLLKKKYFIINIDKLSYSANKYNLRNINSKNYSFFRADIGNKSSISKILLKYKPIYFFNLAAETHVDRSIDTPKPFIDNNIRSVFNLLETIKKYIDDTNNKIKLIHISTDEVYGDLAKTKRRANENFPYKPSSPYAASKASADHLIKSYIRTYKFPAIISNCSNNYGPSQFPEKLIPKIIFNLINNKPIPIYNKGLNTREWIHVSDHCAALEILARKGIIGENYNIGSNKDLTNIDLAKYIIKVVSKIKKIKKNVKIIYVTDRPGHDFRYALNSNKIRKQLNWRPKVNLKQGIETTVEWYLNNLEYFKTIKKQYMQRQGLKI